MTTTLDDIRAEARQIIKAVAEARRTAKPRGRLWRPSDLAAEIGRGNMISSIDTPLDAYMKGIRYWAQRVAPQITVREWETMGDALEQEFTELGLMDPTSFLDHLFDGLTLKDGVAIWA